MRTSVYRRNISAMFLITLLIAIFGHTSLVTISTADAQAIKRRRGPARKKPSGVRQPSLDELAFAEFWKQFGVMRFTKCGPDTYLSRDWVYGRIGQHKGGLWTMERDQLSEADTLNGVEYRGQPGFKWTVGRVKSDGVWGPWVTPEDNAGYWKGLHRYGDFPFPYVWRVNGRWQVVWPGVPHDMEHWFEKAKEFPPPLCAVLQDSTAGEVQDARYARSDEDEWVEVNDRKKTRITLKPGSHFQIFHRDNVPIRIFLEDETEYLGLPRKQQFTSGIETDTLRRSAGETAVAVTERGTKSMFPFPV